MSYDITLSPLRTSHFFGSDCGEAAKVHQKEVTEEKVQITEVNDDEYNRDGDLQF